MRTQKFDNSEASPEAQALADALLAKARKQVARIDVPARARTLGWQARLEAVTKGHNLTAAVYLEALAVLGDKGAINGVQQAATVTA